MATFQMTADELASVIKDQIADVKRYSSLVESEQAFYDAKLIGMKRLGSAIGYRLFKGNDVERWKWLHKAGVE
jgi:hypothetical protein